MSYENYIPFYQSEEGTTLRPGDCATYKFSGRVGERMRLFVTGETALHYLWKDEPDYPAQYRKIEDALDGEHAFEAQFCLNLGNRAGVDYVKRAYKKVSWPPVLSYLPLHSLSAEWEAGVWVRADGLEIAEGGYLRMRIEVRLRRAGVHPNSVAGEPDATEYIDIPAGTYGWTKLSLPVNIPLDTAHVGILIEGFGYTGELYVERPYLSSNGYNVLPDFASSTPDKEWFEWTGQNLSRKEWPEVRVTLNGSVVYEGEVFERCHRCSEWAIALPRELVLPGENEVSISLISAYHDPMPYTLHELSIVTQPADALEIVACPSNAPAHGIAAILIRTAKPDMRLTFESEAELEAIGELSYPEAGLNVLQLKCGAPALDARFTLHTQADDGELRVEGRIKRIVFKQEDHVITGTGDMIYINQNLTDVAEYLGWYLSNEVGNMLTIRPTYRWCGSRVVKPEVWKLVNRILDGMGVDYAHMMDGRELPGKDANPSIAMLDSKHFLGRQTHERDGAQFYWGRRESGGSRAAEQYFDMEQRIYREHPEYTSTECDSSNYFYDGRDLFLYRPRELPRDMRQAGEFAVNILRDSHAGASRHTGPSVMFKYFLEAGYDWVGAETMYGSMEPLLAFLRGASACYGKTEMGVHHAVQWSSSPHDTPERFRRYRLALYVSYMQGVTQINTEEGLWHMEEYYVHFHRFSDACKGHQQQQCDFYRYVATHSRTGRFYTPMALVHGRLDGWHAFGHNNPWGIFNEKDCDAEKSWELLKAIYPLSKPGDTLYIHGCPNEAVGYHTGTPHGNIDAVPAESPQALFDNYKVLSFIGYNLAESGDFDRLSAYVKQGGALIIGWPHAITNTARTEIASYAHSYIDHELTQLAGGTPKFVESAYNGKPLHIAESINTDGEILARTDDGQPLLMRYELGDGNVYWVNAMEYPGHEAVKPLYESILRTTADTLRAAEPCDIECGNDVEYTTFIQPDGSRHFYVLAVDWFAAPETIRHAELRIGEARYHIELPFGTLLKVVVNGDYAAWATSEAGEVLNVSPDGAQVQGEASVSFVLAHNNKTCLTCPSQEGNVLSFREKWESAVGKN